MEKEGWTCTIICGAKGGVGRARSSAVQKEGVGLEPSENPPTIKTMAGIALEIGVDPKLTEQFLLSQPEIVNASVWLSGGRMHAHVTVSEYADWTRGSLQLACMEQLGPDQTPREVILVASRRLAA